jgi:hypothetical protein
MGGEAGAARLRPQAPVNNFAAAIAAIGLGWLDWLISGYPSFPAPAGPGLQTTSRRDDCELIDRPAGRDLHDDSRGRL